MKIKLFITYESFEDGIQLTFEEFMKLPQRKSEREFLNFFPMFRFKILLMNLTFDQKEDYVQRHLSCCSNKVQLKIMRELLAQEKQGKVGFSLDISDLKTLSIFNVIKEREQNNNRLTKTSKST